MYKKSLLIFIAVFLVGTVLAWGVGNGNGNGGWRIDIPTPPISINYSLIPTVNSSDYWDNLDVPTDIPNSEFWYNLSTATYNMYGSNWYNHTTDAISLADIKFLNLSGTNANQDINISPYNFEATNITVGKYKFTDTEYISSDDADYVDIHFTDDDKGVRFWSGANNLVSIRRVSAGVSTGVEFVNPGNYMRFEVSSSSGFLEFKVGGVTQLYSIPTLLTTYTNLRSRHDNLWLGFGTGTTISFPDAKLSWDGTNFIINTTAIDINALAYFTNSTSAEHYFTRTSVFDNSQGDALDFIQNADYYLKEGKVEHSKFYGYTTYEVTDFSRPVEAGEEEICDFDEISLEISNCRNETIYEYPYRKIEEAVSLNKEIDVLRQAVYELNERIKVLEGVEPKP